MELKRQAERRSWENYVADGLFAVAGNTIYKVTQKGVLEIGQKMSGRWAEAVGAAEKKAQETEKEQEDNRSCGEIAADMWARMRGRRR